MTIFVCGIYMKAAITNFEVSGSVGIVKPAVLLTHQPRLITSTTLMKIFLLGATGKTGQQILSQALAASHTVTALVRSLEKVARPQERLTVIVGEALDQATVEQAVQSDHSCWRAFSVA